MFPFSRGRLTLAAVAFALLAACTTSPTPTPTPTSLDAPDLTASEVQRSSLEAIREVDSYRATGTVHLVIEGEPDQIGTQLHEIGANGFRMVMESSDGSSYSELLCVGDVMVSRDSRAGEWREQSLFNESSCRGLDMGSSGLIPRTEALDLQFVNWEGERAYLLTLREVNENSVTPEPGRGAVTKTTRESEITIDPKMYLPIRSVVHQEMPATHWIGNENSGVTASTTTEQYSDETYEYSYDEQVDLQLPEGFES